MNKEKGEKSHNKEKIALFYYKHSFLRKKHAPRTTCHFPFSIGTQQGVMNVYINFYIIYI